MVRRCSRTQAYILKPNPYPLIYIQMKKIFLVIAGISLFSTAFSQFTYGPKLGVNTAHLPNDNIAPGIQFGGFLNGELDDRMGIQVDFLWTLKGNVHQTTVLDSLTGQPTSTKYNTTTYYRFVDIPICAYFPISKHVRGFIGKQLSIFRKAHETIVYPGKTIERDLTGITTKGSSWIAGFDFNLNSPLIIGMRFGTNAFSQPDPTGGAINEMKLGFIMINFAYKMHW